MKPLHEKRHIASQFAAARLRIGAKDAIAVGIRAEQHLLYEEYRGMSNQLPLTSSTSNSRPFGLCLPSGNPKQQIHARRQRLGSRDAHARRYMQELDRQPYAISAPHTQSPRGPLRTRGALSLRQAGLVIFDGVISMICPVPIFITVSVALGVKLGEHGADYTTTCELKSLDSTTNQADSNLARTRDKNRCSRHA